ncbi:recombinase family protein [Oscillospiraceae bacterium OttesenSCG-928-F05]|nr:recombinase family protein [Oscillospiraceae bacterium OttesenSCG-928-F05]
MNAVIYARYSSDNQREESIEGQLRECKEYADKTGLVVIGTYIDRAYSAKTDNRPEFQRMIKDSAKRQFEIVLVWKLDRFARSREDSAMNKHKLRRNGVKVVSATENISEKSDGILLEAVLEGMAEYYSAELSEKIIRGMTENALKCKYNGGSMPLGYTKDGNQQYTIDPDTAPIVQEIFQRYADGETIVEITSSLNVRGLKTSHGNPYNKNSLHHLLTNRHFIGEYCYRDIVVPGGIPAIIDKELFENVQSIMAKNKKAPAMKKADFEYLLTTKLFCGKCGAFMVGESGTSKTGRKYYYYKCAHAKSKKGCTKKTVRKDAIERFVVTETKQRLFHGDTVERLAEAVVTYQHRENPSLPLLHKQLSETEKSIGNMLNAIQQGIITASTKQRLGELEARKEALEISIAQEQIERPPVTKEQVIYWVNRFRDGDIDDPKHCRDIIDIFVNAVYLYDDKLILLCNYKDGTKTVTFDQVNSSDLMQGAPPFKAQHFFCKP